MKPLILIGLSTGLLLQACSHISYVKTFQDGTKLEVTGVEIGTDKALEGFRYQSDAVQMEVDSLEQNQTNGLAAIVEGAVRGAAKGLKP